MKKAIALSCAVFSLCMAMTSCGNKSDDSTAESNKETSTAVTTKMTTTTQTTTEETTEETTEMTTSDSKTVDTGDDGFIGDDDATTSDGSSPLDVIPDTIETAASDAGNIVSDVIDDLT